MGSIYVLKMLSIILAVPEIPQACRWSGDHERSEMDVSTDEFLHGHFQSTNNDYIIYIYR